MRALVVGRSFRGLAVLPPLVGGLLALAPWVGLDRLWIRELTLIAILTLLVSGFNLTFGYAGELALGQIAIFGVASYAAGYSALHGVPDVFAQCAIAVASALVVGVISGVPGLRVGGWSLAMISFFLVILVPDVVTIFPEQTGGAVGMYAIPALTLFGDVVGPQGLATLAVVLAVIWLVSVRNYIVSRHGQALHLLRTSPVLAASTGIGVYRTKLTVYLLSSIPLGFAGVVQAHVGGFLSASSFSFEATISLLAAAVISGRRTIYAAAVGAAVVEIVALETSQLGSFSTLTYGGILIIGGIVSVRWSIRRLMRASRLSTPVGRPRGRIARSSFAAHGDNAGAETGAGSESRPFVGTERRTGGTATDLFSGISGERLLISELSKSFGGIQALAGVSLEAKPGEITAIIGPNGSGKTTLLNLVAGFYRIQSGVIKVGQHSLNGLSAHAIALLGVVRTFQQPLVAEQMSVLDAVSIVRYGRNPVSILQSVFRSPRHFRAGREDAEIACAAIESVRLQSVSHVDAAALPLGTRRMTELARVIAAQPNAVLLDEIASGLDEGELEEMVSILRRMRAAGATILMVEHNLQLVMSLADQVYVLAQGRVVLAGSPDEVKASPILEAELLGTRTARPDVDDAAPQSDSVQVEQ